MRSWGRAEMCRHVGVVVVQPWGVPQGSMWVSPRAMGPRGAPWCSDALVGTPYLCLASQTPSSAA